VNDYVAWYAVDTEDDPAPSTADCHCIFRRNFQADDLDHALEQATDAQEDGELLLGVKDQ
jgi:hypothetical protein